MKKYFISLILIFNCLVAVAQDFKGTPILGVTPIERVIDNSQNKSANLEQELANQTTPAARIVGTPTGNSTEVGITEGQLSVSLSGAANYSIPIAVPPGINGVVPQISLVYNSQGGNGMAGYGWNISGISMITRIPSTKFHDNVIDPVDFDALDRFALDGQRLLLKDPTQTYGAAGTVYETENFSNIKITAVGGTNNNPTSFTVEYPDGSIASYATKTPTNWSITYWQNLQALRISYTYHLESNVLYITKIAYGATFANTPTNEINFVLEENNRHEQAFVGGISFVNKYAIRSIKVKSNNVGYRNYFLRFDTTSLGYNRLTSVTELSGDETVEYNPTVFSYDTTNNNTLFETYPVSIVPVLSGLNNQNSTVINGDFDADGKADMIIYATTGDFAKNQYTLVTNLTGNDVNNATLNTSVGNFEDIFSVAYTNFSNKIFPQQGWCVVKKSGSSYSFQTHNSWIGVSSPPPLYLQTPRIVYFPTEVVISNNNPSCTNQPTSIVPKKKLLSGDFNGDGITDVIAIDLSERYCIRLQPGTPYTQNSDSIAGDGCSCQYWQFKNILDGGKVYFIDLKTNTTINLIAAIGHIGGVIATNNIQVVDFNGDGKSDIMVLREGNVQYYSLNDNNQLVQIYNYSEPAFQINKPLLVGDYNGDGKTDFCIPQVEGEDKWFFYFSTGTGLAGKQAQIGILYRTLSCDYYNFFREMYYITSDFNNDGKSDIIGFSNSTTLHPDPGFGTPNREGIICQANSNVTQPIRTQFVFAENRIANNDQVVFNTNATPWGQNFNLKRYPIIAMLDHNNRNNKSEFTLIQDNKMLTFKQPKDSAKDMLLRKITTGNGVEESITYKPLKEENVNAYDYNNPNLYYSNGNLLETYPNMDIIAAPSFKVVSKLEKQSTSVYKKQFFTYAGAVSNVNGLGFLGFRSTMRTNWHDGIAPNYLISNVSINDISLRGANVGNFSAINLWRADATLPSSGFISKSKNVYNKHFKLESFTSPLLANKVFKLYLTDSEQFNGLENTKSTTKTRYDVYNNPFISTTNLFNGASYEQNTVSSVTYENNTATGTYIVGRPLTKNTSTIIYPANAALRDETKSEEVYSYQNNLLSEVKKRSTNSGQISNFLTEQNDYDTFGNITQKRILATGLATRITNYEYNPTSPFNGRFLTKSTDIEGLATEFTYNPTNGLLLSEKNPYNLTTSYEYDKWFKKTKVTDYLGKSKYFSYGRYNEKTLITTLADDSSASSEFFDDLGRKLQSTVKDINSVLSTEDYLYDIHDRNFKTSEPYFTNASPTQWNTTTFDGYGRPIRSDSFTVKFVTIDYAGLTTTVSENVTLPAPQVVKTKATTKNAIGNVIAMTETVGGVPGGTIYYTYFANGNLKTTSFGGATTTITQDSWGRKKQLDDPSAGTYQYTYNDFGETLTETVRASATGNIKGITTNTIDAVGKVSEKTIVGQNGDMTNSKTTYTYDPTDKLLTAIKFEDLTAGNLTNYSYQYDKYKRQEQSWEDGFQAFFSKTLQYDSFGRIEKEYFNALTIPDFKYSNKWIKYTYKNGYQHQIIDDSDNKVLREIKTINARGQLTSAQNNHTQETHTYNAFGYQTNINHLNISGPNYSNSGTAFLSLNTNFDAQRGNLLSRSNPFATSQENFTYDNQDRLLTYPNETGVTQTQSYDVAGKITANNIGNYAYTNTTKPYQLTSITPIDQSSASPVLNYYINRNQDIKYNVFKSPVSIMEQGKENIFFEYNAFNQRSTMYYGGLQTDKNLLPMRKFYNADGTMEIKRTLSGGVEFTTYIGGDAYSAPIMLKSNGVTQSYLYLCRDYQGSIIAVTDVDGLLLNKRFYDAWGKLSHNENRACPVASCPMLPSMPTTTNGLAYTDRGYTGHEMLLGVGLINMNARLYDPKLHRFLAPDSITDYSNTQSLNGYNYCYNNPLKYTDESGNWAGWDDLGAFVVGGLFNWAVNGFKLNAAGAAYFVNGGLSGLATLYGGPLAGAAVAGAGNNIIDQVSSGKKFDVFQVLQATIVSVAITGALMGLGDVIKGVFKAVPKVPLESVNKLPTPEIIVGETVAPAMGNFTITTTTATGAANTAAGTVANTTKELAKAGLVDVTDNVGRKIVGAGIINLDEVVVQGAAKSGTNALNQVVVHGNSLLSAKPTWGYKLFNIDGTFLKNGITNKLIPEGRYTKAFMSDKYMEAIPFQTRLPAYQWEFQQNVILKGPLNLNMH